MESALLGKDWNWPKGPVADLVFMPEDLKISISSNLKRKKKSSFRSLPFFASFKQQKEIAIQPRRLDHTSVDSAVDSCVSAER